MTLPALEEDLKQNIFRYIPTKTALKFHHDKSGVRLAMGPVGCGKSVACCMELFRLMSSQEPSPDGFRRTRMVVTRETYPDLTSTTLKTWKTLFPTPDTGRIVHGSPIVHYFEWGDIKSEVVFMSVETEDDIRKLMSLEATFFWINECRFSLLEILRQAKSRSGRYPSIQSAGVRCTRSGVILDTNPPDDDHWIYELFEVQRPNDYSIFHYEPGVIKNDKHEWIVNDNAENLSGLSEGKAYYAKQINGATDEWINVYLGGNYGTSYDGRPVFPEYNDAVHYDPKIEPVKGIPLILGWDFGMTPALTIAQMLPNGRLIFIDEITTDYMGITNFVNNAVIPVFSSRYEGYKIELSVGDPAGNSDLGTGLNQVQTCLTILKDYGFPTVVAKTNKWLPRKEAVSRRLSVMVDGKPAVAIGPRMKRTRKGFNGAYCYKRINVAVGKGETRYKDEPDKDMYSHPMDTVQYICLQYDRFKTAPAVNENSMWNQKPMRIL